MSNIIKLVPKTQPHTAELKHQVDRIVGNCFDPENRGVNLESLAAHLAEAADILFMESVERFGSSEEPTAPVGVVEGGLLSGLAHLTDGGAA